MRLVRSRRSARLSTVTVISIVGVAFGVMALTVVLGVTSGFQGAFQERILGLYPHIVVLRSAGDFRGYQEVLEDIRATEGVVAATPATYDDMMMAAGVHRSGAVIKGVELSSVDEVLGLRGLIKAGSLDALTEEPLISHDSDVVQINDVVAKTWLTIVARDGRAPLVLRDDRTPPDPGRARVAVLDLRGDASPQPILLTSASPPDPDLGEPLVAPVALGNTVPGGLTDAAEVRAGSWKLELTGDEIELVEGTVITILIHPGDGGELDTRLLTEAGRIPTEDRVAMVRLVNGSSRPTRLAKADGAPVSPELGSWEFTTYTPLAGRLPGILLGTELAKRLNVDLGSEITVVTPLRGVDNKMLGPYGMAPSSSRHVVTGLFESGFYEYDVRLALMSLQAAQRFLNRGPVIRWIEVKADDLLLVRDLKRRLSGALDPFDLGMLTAQADGFERKVSRFLEGDVRSARHDDPATFVGSVRNALQLVNLLKYQELDFGYQPTFRLIDWQEMNNNLFSALKLQKVVLTIFFLIIIIVGAFVVAGSQIMVIHEKTPDIAILKTMGATSGVIRAIFTLQGLLVAGVGTVGGVITGIAACWLIHAVDYQLDASVYLIDRLPVHLDGLDLVIVAVATAACTLAATQYSSGRAASKTVVDGLRSVD